MRKYKITVVLPTGDEIRAKVVAVNSTAAIEKIKASSQYREFIGDTPEDDIYFLNDGFEEVQPVAVDSCRLTTFEGVGCAVEHVATGAVIGFEEGRFNATASVLRCPETMDATEIASIMREVGEWLYCFHRRKVLSIREITSAFMAKSKITGRALAMELCIDETALSSFLAGRRPLPFEQLEHLLVILKQAGEI